MSPLIIHGSGTLVLLSQFCRVVSRDLNNLALPNAMYMAWILLGTDTSVKYFKHICPADIKMTQNKPICNASHLGLTTSKVD